MPTAFSLDASGAAEPDGDLAPFDDDRHPPASGKPDHPVELFLVRLDVDVGEGDLSFRVVLTGRGRVGSRVFSEMTTMSSFSLDY
jgi:hypothetical protein